MYYNCFWFYDWLELSIYSFVRVMEVMLMVIEENKFDMEYDKFDSYEFDRNEFGNG